jgi:hypothetical protein
LAEQAFWHSVPGIDEVKLDTHHAIRVNVVDALKVSLAQNAYAKLFSQFTTQRVSRRFAGGNFATGKLPLTDKRSVSFTFGNQDLRLLIAKNSRSDAEHLRWRFPGQDNLP